MSGSNINDVTTHVANVEVVERELPLGEGVVTVDVNYKYKNGVLLWQ